MTRPDQQLFSRVAETVSAWRYPLLLTHVKPDGDALGSLTAMRSFLRSQGAEPLALLFDPIPDRYAVFHRFDPMPVWKSDATESDLTKVDGIIVLDTCTYSQLHPIGAWLHAVELPKVALDHHVTRDDLADHYVIDESAAAACLILYDWARAVDWPLSRDAVEAMFIGIAMDTGWFRHSNTDERVLAASADLVSRGATAHELHEQMFHRESPARIRLLGVALGTMELLAEERLAVMTLSADAIKKVGATPADTEDIVNEPLRIGSTVVSILIVEHEKEMVRVSFRSKPPLGPDTTTSDIDVASLAQSFGGGGHKRAAGARVAGSVTHVRNEIVKSLELRMRA